MFHFLVIYQFALCELFLWNNFMFAYVIFLAFKVVSVEFEFLFYKKILHYFQLLYKARMDNLCSET